MQIELLIAIEIFKTNLNNLSSNLISYLLAGNLKEFEEQLSQSCMELYNQLATIMLSKAVQSDELKQKARIIGQKKGLSEIRKSEVTLKLKTGHIVSLFSWYASRSKPKLATRKRGPNGQGCHLILEYWGCIEKATPGYYSYLSMLSVLCPSFEVVLQVLNDQHIQAEYKRIQKIAYGVGEKCFDKRVPIGLTADENVGGKRVIISIDGGRTRLCEENPNKKPSSSCRGKRAKFDTPWCEPKLLVIHIGFGIELKRPC